MKCRNCGFELHPTDIFCGNCGTRIQAEDGLPMANYINIGHPIGYTKIYNQIVYLIDNGLQQIQVTQEAFLAWAKMPQETPAAEELSMLETRECVLDANNPAHISRLMNCIPCRQGFGAVLEDKHAIVLGRSPIFITETQMIVWRLADGRNTLTRIGMMTGMDSSEVIEVLRELIGFDLVYLKFTR